MWSTRRKIFVYMKNKYLTSWLAVISCVLYTRAEKSRNYSPFRFVTLTQLPIHDDLLRIWKANPCFAQSWTYVNWQDKTQKIFHPSAWLQPEDSGGKEVKYPLDRFARMDNTERVLSTEIRLWSIEYKIHSVFFNERRINTFIKSYRWFSSSVFQLSSYTSYYTIFSCNQFTLRFRQFLSRSTPHA